MSDQQQRTLWAVEKFRDFVKAWTPPAGTHGSTGDVRRCEHGNVWLFYGRGASWRFDHWTRLRWWANPIRYRRARLALAAANPAMSAT